MATGGVPWEEAGDPGDFEIGPWLPRANQTANTSAMTASGMDGFFIFEKLAF